MASSSNWLIISAVVICLLVYRLANDPRARLYLEYLQLIADFWPVVFIMENVRGLLSASIDSSSVVARIVEDLTNPAAAITREGRTRTNIAGPCARHSVTESALTQTSTEDGDTQQHSVC